MKRLLCLALLAISALSAISFDEQLAVIKCYRERHIVLVKGHTAFKAVRRADLLQSWDSEVSAKKALDELKLEILTNCNMVAQRSIIATQNVDGKATERILREMAELSANVKDMRKDGF